MDNITTRRVAGNGKQVSEGTGPSNTKDDTRNVARVISQWFPPNSHYLGPAREILAACVLDARSKGPSESSNGGGKGK